MVCVMRYLTGGKPSHVMLYTWTLASMGFKSIRCVLCVLYVQEHFRVKMLARICCKLPVMRG